MCVFGGCPSINRRTFVAGSLAISLMSGAADSQPSALPIERQDRVFTRGGDRISGYVAFPAAHREARVVAVMHGNAGLPADIRETADWLASQGYVGLAIDPTSREPDPKMLTRAILMGRAYGDRYIDDTRFGIEQLMDLRIGREHGRIGIVGYCGGGYCGLLWNDTPHRAELQGLVAIHTALHNHEADGTISTARPQGIDLFRLMNAPAQFHFGTADSITPPPDIAELRQAARIDHRRVDIFTYEGADHGFALSSHDTYRPDYTAKVRKRAAGFLRQHLR